MFDLKFHPSVLDKMPVGTSFSVSGHEISKKNEGWKCEDCGNSILEDSSSAYVSSPSREYSLDKFAGAEIDPDNLDPRLLSFLPAGTRVADRDTQSDNRWHWHKTKTDRWYWTDSQEGAEAAANNGRGFDDLGDYDVLRPFRLFSLGTAEAPESDGTPADPVRLTAAEATSLRDSVCDSGGREWVYTSEGGYRLSLGGELLGKLREQLPADYAPFVLVEGEVEAEPEVPEGKTCFTAAEATNFRDCCFRDRDGDVWVFDEETELWRLILPYGSLSNTFQNEELRPDLEPFVLVEGEVEAEPETETETEAEPEDKTEFSASEASKHKDTVFKDDEGDTWFFDYGLWLWRAIGPGWVCANEDLNSSYEPYTRVCPLYEFDRPWTAGEANDFKDEALEDGDGDIWVYDVPSEKWKCNNVGAPDSSELDEAYQPYRIKKAAQRRAAPEATVLGYDEPVQNSEQVTFEGSAPEAILLGYDEPVQNSEQVTFEGSAKEAVELLDRIARSLESIDRKLGDK